MLIVALVLISSKDMRNGDRQIIKVASLGVIDVELLFHY